MARLFQPKVSVVEARRQWPRASQGHRMRESVEGKSRYSVLGIRPFLDAEARCRG